MLDQAAWRRLVLRGLKQQLDSSLGELRGATEDRSGDLDNAMFDQAASVLRDLEQQLDSSLRELRAATEDRSDDLDNAMFDEAVWRRSVVRGLKQQLESSLGELRAATEDRSGDLHRATFDEVVWCRSVIIGLKQPLESSLGELRGATEDLRVRTGSLQQRITSEEAAGNLILDYVRRWASEAETLLAIAHRLLWVGPNEVLRLSMGDGSNSLFLERVTEHLNDVRSKLSNGVFSGITYHRRGQRPFDGYELDSNLRELRSAKEAMQQRKRSLLESITSEEAAGNRILDSVKEWVSDAETLVREADRLLQDHRPWGLSIDDSKPDFAASVAQNLKDVQSKHRYGVFTGGITHLRRRRNESNQGQNADIPNSLATAASAAAVVMGNDRPNSLATAASAAAVVTDNEELLILFVSLIVEGLSAVFEQLGKDLLGFQMAVFGLLICVAEILYRVRAERVSLGWLGNLPFLYSHYPTYKLFGTTVQCFGLLAAVWQCLHATLGYLYARKHSENPIKMTLTTFLFCLCLIVSKIVNKFTAIAAAVVIDNTEYWLILFMNLIVEALSAAFEQSGKDLLGFQMAVFGLLICVAEILYRARAERVSMVWVRNLPFLYSHHPNYKPFGTSLQCFGLLAAFWQCFHASLGYYYARKNLQNPIKMTVTMFLFCFCLIVSKSVNKYTRRPLSGAHSA